MSSVRSLLQRSLRRMKREKKRKPGAADQTCILKPSLTPTASELDLSSMNADDEWEEIAEEDCEYDGAANDGRGDWYCEDENIDFDELEDAVGYAVSDDAEGADEDEDLDKSVIAGQLLRAPAQHRSTGRDMGYDTPSRR